jgi:hypothetical protein
MIRKRILGISLETRRSRRLFVAGFWMAEAIALVLLFQFPMPVDVRHGLLLLIPTLAVASTLPILLGGFSQGGAVKFYEGRPVQLTPEAIARLSANPERADRVKRFLAAMRPLDEREVQLRDWAYHRAHRLLYWMLYLGLVVYLMVAGLSFSLVARFGFVLLEFFLVASMSLPQSLLLWTLPEDEPQMGGAQ